MADRTSPLIHNAEVATRRFWRLSAAILGKLAEHVEKSSQDPVAAKLNSLSPFSTWPSILATAEGDLEPL